MVKAQKQENIIYIDSQLVEKAQELLEATIVHETVHYVAYKNDRKGYYSKDDKGRLEMIEKL